MSNPILFNIHLHQVRDPSTRLRHTRVVRGECESAVSTVLEAIYDFQISLDSTDNYGNGTDF